LHIFEFVKPANYPDEPIECVRRGSSKAWTPLAAFARNNNYNKNDGGIDENDPNNVSAATLNTTHVAQHLLPLFTYAADIIPSQYHKTTAVRYQATAGMRLLDIEEQDEIYDALYEGLMMEPQFYFRSASRQDFGTLSGPEEAFYGAVAANYLKGLIDVHLHMIQSNNNNIDEENFDKEYYDENSKQQQQQYAPLGALDMGGSSTQIVFLSTDGLESCKPNSDLNESDETGEKDDLGMCQSSKQKSTPARMRGEDFFSISYLSYGVDQFRERLWDTWVNDYKIKNSNDDSNHGNVIILNPCSFEGHTVQWKNDYTLLGTGDAKKCTEEVTRLIPHYDDADKEARAIEEEASGNGNKRNLVGGIEHPPIRGKFFAMSLYFFTLDCLRELSAHEGLNMAWPTPSIDELTEALDGLCSRKWKGDLEEIQHEAHEHTRAEVLPDRCFESVYLVTLLRDGFGFHPSSRDITFSFHVDGSEVEWSMGLAMSLYARQRDEEDENINRDVVSSIIQHSSPQPNSPINKTCNNPHSSSYSNGMNPIS